MTQSIMKINKNRTKNWYLNDKLHRENGPAIEYANGNKEWWFNGIENPELEDILTTKAHLDGTLSKNESIKSKRKI